MIGLPLLAGMVQLSWTPRPRDRFAVRVGAPGTAVDVTVTETVVAWTAGPSVPVTAGYTPQFVDTNCSTGAESPDLTPAMTASTTSRRLWVANSPR